MMTGWEQDVVTKRWRPSAPRVEPLGRRDRCQSGESRARLPATLLAVDDVCWACRARVRAIVGVLVDRALTEDRSGFLALADVDRILLAVLDAGALAERGIGALRHRHSPGVQGGFRVDDLLAEHLALGGALADLAVDITVDLLGDRVWRGAPLMR
jgi:hypothetical protein